MLLRTLCLCLVLGAGLNLHAQEDSLQDATYRANLQRTGVHETTGLPSASGVKWTYQTGGPVRSSPVIVGRTLFVGSRDGFIYAIDAARGDLRWKVDTGGKVNGSATVSNGTVYIASEAGRFYALDATTGEVRWQHAENRCATASSAALLDGVVYFGAARSGMDQVSMGGGVLIALDAESGKRLWHAPGPQGVGSPAILRNLAIVNSGGGTYYYALDLQSKGARVWSVKSGHQARQFNSAAVANGRVYLPFSMRGSIACCDPEGKDIWRAATNPLNLEMEMNSGGLFEYACFTELAVTRELVFVGCQDGGLYAFDADSGEHRWTHATEAPVLTGSPSVAGGLVYFGSNDKHLYAVDMQGHEKWKVELGGAVNSSPWPGDGVVYVGCDDGKVYAIE